MTDTPPRIKIELCYPNGCYCRTVYAPSKYLAKQLKRHYECSGLIAEIIPDAKEDTHAPDAR